MLIKNNESGSAWCPTSVAKFEGYVERIVNPESGYKHYYALRKNLAYNLQYLQLQDRILQDIKLTSVLTTQTIKTTVLVGVGIVESLLHFLLIKNGKHSVTEWREKCKLSGNPKKIDNELIRADTVINVKLEKPELKHMTFDSMIKCAKSNQLLGTHPEMYKKLEALRGLRNKVHLQIINNPTDTDWNSFNETHLSDLCKVLYAIMTSSIFSPSNEEKNYFDFLRRNFKA